MFCNITLYNFFESKMDSAQSRPGILHMARILKMRHAAIPYLSCCAPYALYFSAATREYAFSKMYGYVNRIANTFSNRI